VAKAQAVSTSRRPPAAPPRAERSNYFAEVYQELKKVSWPNRVELARMTQIVVLTVLIFAALIGAVDFLLSLIVKQLYVQNGSTTLGTFHH
jgi:preprotein translocase subunit SecE